MNTKTAPTHSTTTYTTTTAPPVAGTVAGSPATAGALEVSPGAATRELGDTMTAQTVVLFTNRPQFERDWAHALDAAGLDPRAAAPAALPGIATKGAALVIDAGAEAYDEDELLAHVGLARALGAVPVVALPSDRDEGGDEIFDDLCEGLVTRRSEDVGRVVASLARRADASRARRFEFLTVSPRGGELLAIFSDGSAVLVDRDVLEQDDGSQVEEIALEDDAMRAMLKLESGVEFELTTSDVARKSLLGGSGANGEIDGVRLGQRIRELRLAAGLTQAELARRTGIHRPNIARVEAGRHTPSLETLSRLANAIGVPTTRVLD